MLHRLVRTCRDVAKRATELDEGCVGLFERLGLRFHMAICSRCQRYLSQLNATKSACGSLRQEGCVDAATKAKLMEQFRSHHKKC